MINRFLTTREQIVLAGVAAAILIGSATVYFMRAAPPTSEPAQAPEAAAVLPAIEELTNPPEPLPPPISAPAPAPVPVPEAVEVVVAVEGAVNLPGVYHLKSTDRVEDAIKQAGGTIDEADLSDINLAAPLIDATTLHIPKEPYAGREGAVLVLRRGPKAADMNPPQYTRSGWRAMQAAGTAAAVTAGSGDAAPLAAAPAGNGLININTASQAELETLPGVGPVTAQKIIAHREAHPFASVDSLTDVSGIGPKTLESVRPFVTVQ